MTPRLRALFTSLAVIAVYGCSTVEAFAAERAADSAPTTPARSGPKWSFNLLPRSFQRRPELRIWVFTEQTPRGLQLRPPSADEPMHFISQSGGYHAMGESVREKPPTPGALQRVLQGALHSQGLEPADEEHPARLLLVFSWGSHNREIEMGGQEFDEARLGDGERIDDFDRFSSSRPTDSMARIVRASPNVMRWGEDQPAAMRKQDQIERAALLVGDTFARQFRADVLSLPEDDGPNGPVMAHLMNSAGLHPRGYFLAQTINQSLYFVIVTAFDLHSLSQNQREPLWRTKIAITSDGVSMTETMPALLVEAAPFMGRDTGAGALITRRIDRRGRVVIGEAEVIDWEVSKPVKPAGAPEVKP